MSTTPATADKSPEARLMDLRDTLITRLEEVRATGDTHAVKEAQERVHEVSRQLIGMTEDDEQWYDED